jgi:hypothetical protein
MADEAYTSDGIARPNMMVEALAMAGIAPTQPIPTSISLSARVGVLNALGNAVNAAGGSVPVLSQWAAYDQSSVTKNINNISAALNSMGATLPIYTDIDYNAFTSIVNKIVTEMAGMQ